MKINVTIDLTRDEVLAAITEKIRDDKRYDHRFPFGEALHIEESKDGYFVEWGEKPIEPKPVAQVTAVEVPPEMETETEAMNKHRVAMAEIL